MEYDHLNMDKEISKLSNLTFKIQTQDILEEIEEFKDAILHYKALPYLFDAIKGIVSESDYILLTEKYKEALSKLKE